MSKKNARRVGQYEIQTANDVSFTVTLLENEDGLREFEIVLSDNASDEYDEVYQHPFYQNFVLPWIYKAKEIPQEGNVVNLSKYRDKKNKK